MAMAAAFLNNSANASKTLVTHIGLVNGSGVELSSSGYARLPVTWTTSSGGAVRPTADLVFNVRTGDTVAGWRGFTALTGGVNEGGAALSPVTFSQDGTYRLYAATTGLIWQ